MKKYFNIKESIKYLNKDINKVEHLNTRDLFYLAAQKHITPCFFYRGEALWQETKAYGNKDKIYEVNELCIYASFSGIGQRLLESLDLNEDFFYVRWVYEVEFLLSEIPEYITQIRLYDPKNDVESLKGKLLRMINDKDASYYGLDPDLSNPKTYRNFLELAYISCPAIKVDFKNVYFEKKELDKLINHQNLLEVSVTEPVECSKDNEMGAKESNNVSLIVGAMAELLQLDLTKPFGESNKKIRETIEKMGGSLGKDTVGRWLERAKNNCK